MKIAFAGFAIVFVLALLVWRIDHVNGQLEAERGSHAVTTKERDEWKAAAEEYRKEATAQAENARTCLDRAAKAEKDAEERTAIMQQAKPRPRLEPERGEVVDDETRRRVVGRLNRPL